MGVRKFLLIWRFLTAGMRYHVSRLRTLLSYYKIKRYFIALVQNPETFAGNRGEMNENIFAFLRRYKPVTLFNIKPFNYPVWHLSNLRNIGIQK